MTDDDLRRMFELLRDDNAGIRQEVALIRDDNAGMRQDFAGMRQDFAGMRQEVAGIREEAAESRQENLAAHADTRRHFDVALEQNRSEIRLVAEAVVETRDDLARGFRSADEKIDRTASDTQAMIRFSHADLDRRMKSLEGDVSDLKSRVERLEESTH